MRYRPLARRGGFNPPTRLRAAANTAYEGGSATGSRSRNWNPSNAGPNSAATNNLSLVRRRARDAVRNDPWAKTAVAKWVANAIGTGIQPYPQHPDKAVRKLLKEYWSDWVNECDADGKLDFYGLQALAARAMFTDGEALDRLRPRRLSDGLVAPLQIQALEADHLPLELNTGFIEGGGEIVNGIEFNAIGQRTHFHLWNRHPGEYGGSRDVRTTRVPADLVVHAFQVLRPGQVRGVSELATVLLRLKTLDNFDDAVAFRQEVSNLFAGFITKPDPDEAGVDPVTGGDAAYDYDSTPVATLEPGSMQELLPGEGVTFASPPGAPDSYAEFMRQQLMAAFASVGIPYELGTGDLRGISDRTLRVVVNEFHRQIEQFQWTVFIHQWCRPIWEAWINALVLAGKISASDFHKNRHQWLRVRWVPQGWAYFNPVQDVQANTDEVRAGFRSRSDVILAKGEDPETVMDEIVADNEFADAHEFIFDSDARKTAETEAQPDESTEPTTDPNTQK